MVSVAHVAEERRAAWAVADQSGPAVAEPRVVFEVLAAPRYDARREMRANDLSTEWSHERRSRPSEGGRLRFRCIGEPGNRRFFHLDWRRAGCAGSIRRAASSRA